MSDTEPAGLDEFVSSQPTKSARAPSMQVSEPDGLDQFIGPELQQEKYGTAGQQLLTGAERLAKGVAGPVATMFEKKLSEAGVQGLAPEDQEARAQANPWTAGIAETAGLVGGAVTGVGEGAMLESAGQAAAKAFMPSSKLGSALVRGAVENGLYQAGDETSKIINNPSLSVESTIPSIGLSGLIGAGVGGAGLGVSALWRATGGAKLGELLHAISKGAGGIEGVEGPVSDVIAKSGMDIAPEVAARVSSEPVTHSMAENLAASASSSGKAYRGAIEDTVKQAGDEMANVFGKEASEVPDEFDAFAAGKKIRQSLVGEVKERLSPVLEGYEAKKTALEGAELSPSVADRQGQSDLEIGRAHRDLNKANKIALEAQKSGNPEAAIEAAAKVEDAKTNIKSVMDKAKATGTTDELLTKVNELVQKNEWDISKSSEIMKVVNSIRDEVPNLKKLSSIGAYIRSIQEKLPYDPFNGERNNAARQLVGIFRDTEADVIRAHIGAKEGAEAVSRFDTLRTQFASESRVKDELSYRLGKLGSTSSYHKAIADIPEESIFRRLDAKGDAAVIPFMTEHFPKTAEAMREAHIEQLLAKAKTADGIDPRKVFKGLDALKSPQLRDFLIPEESREKAQAIESLLDMIKNKSGLGAVADRTANKIMKDAAGSGVGLVTSILSHSPILGYLTGAVAKFVGYEAPDAARLALLKFMGSAKQIEPGAFKTMMGFISDTIRGDNLVSRASESIFKSASQVIPANLIPTEKNLASLDKRVSELTMNQDALAQSGSSLNHYMDTHAMASAATASRAVEYLATLKPQDLRPGPLDPVMKPSAEQKQKYNRALLIAEQPLMVLKLAKEGRLTTDDMNHLNSMYPEFSDRIKGKLMDKLSDLTAKKEPIPYKMRSQLSLLMGSAMDSSVTPQNVQANQAAFSQAAAQSAMNNMPAKRMPASAIKDMKAGHRMSLRPSDND